MPDFFSRAVVCNTGPLLGLSRVGLAGLVPRLFPEVLVPREVADELLVAPHTDVPELRRTLLTFRVLDEPAASDPLLLAVLDRGEAAVITVALREGCRQVLMDERRGRRVAQVAYGLEVRGTAGLLVAAKRRGLIPSVGPLLGEMREQGYFLGAALVAECLRQAGER